ncbi:MAG: P1 family peptidase [Clostridiales Family XIII bacterium]|jgi:L-aminopeptidase/D-esterase-like protein|nr:P1 family peptidase [Clostridiales Family XIII bacterium]
MNIQDFDGVREIAITDFDGVKIGNAENAAAGTGCTVILCEKGAVAGVDVRGGGPATRETEALKSVNLVEKIHAVVLSGGSAFGLDAASGVMKFLEERGVGFETGFGKVPLVCGASLFDLNVGDGRVRPDGAMGYAACANAISGNFTEGNFGAGTGASVGKYLGSARMMKSGIGAFAVQVGAVKCGAVVAVNALGDVVDDRDGRIVAGLLNENGDGFADSEGILLRDIERGRNIYQINTTLGCVLTNARLTKTAANRLAMVAHNGYARVIRPVHTSADGDTIFAMSTRDVDVDADVLGSLASAVIARAAVRAVRAAQPAYGLKAARDIR